MRAQCRRIRLALIPACLAIAGEVFAQSAASDGVTPTKLPGPQPLAFEQNNGQADSRVRYLARARDYAVALTSDEALLLLRNSSTSDASRRRFGDLSRLRMRLAGASRSTRITAQNQLPGKIYYAGGDAHGPLTPIETFGRIEYGDVYPGIDVVYYGDDRQLEFDFVVSPFADPARIALTLEGAERMALTDNGDLSVRVSGTEISLKKPIVYQDREEGRVAISAAYLLPADGTRTVRFQLGDYDPALPLVIDPTWTAVFGSTNEDWLTALEVDSTGHPRALGLTFDPVAFPVSETVSGALTPPNCFLAKFDPATGLPDYTILFRNATRCDTLALSPHDVAYFTGYVFTNGFPHNQGTTVTVVDDSTGVPAVRRFVVGNNDSSAIGGGVDAIAVNSLEHVFLLGRCRIVDDDNGDPPLDLAGYNEDLEPAHDVYSQGCAPQIPGTTPVEQPILTVVDSTGAFLYGSFLSPAEPPMVYGLTADDADRAYIVGSQSSTLSPTADAYRAACPQAGTRGVDACGYLMVLDTTTTGPDSLVYASYLWNTDDVDKMVVRLSPAGDVYIASEEGVFDDFPGNRPSSPVSWPYSLYPTLRNGIQFARFTRDQNGSPNHLQFAMVFDPSRPVAALAGLPVREALANLRIFPSGALAVGSIAYTATTDPLGIVTTFSADAERHGQIWTQNLGSRSPVAFDIATDAGGNLFLAGQVDRVGAQDSDVFVERLDAADPSGNQPPTVSIMTAAGPGGTWTMYADSPSGGTLQLTANATDPDGDTLTYSWSGPFTNNPITSNYYLEARLAVGTQQRVTVTVDDGHGNTASATLLVNVVGTPFVGTTATPIDSELNGLIFNYAPVTITATAISAGPANAYLRTRLDQNPPIPSNLQAGSPPIYFDVSTDATLMQPPIQVCVDTTGMSFADAAHIRLYQYQRVGPLAAWTDITLAGYPQGHQLCGQSNTLETFAIFYPQVPPTAVRTIAGNGVLVNSDDGPGNNPVDDYVDGPATSTPLNYLYGGAYDRANNRLFISDAGGYIYRVNLNNNTIARVAGNGVRLPGILDGPDGDSRDDLVEAGNAFTTYVGSPAELALSPTGDVVFFDRNTCRIRRLDLAQSRVFAVAGNGTCGFSGDGFSAGLASIGYGQMAYDAAGNLFLADQGSARVRRIDSGTNIISTVVGDGTFAPVLNGTPALSGIGQPLGLAFDAQGQLLVTNGMDLLRVSTGADGLVNGDAAETISLIGGCHTDCALPFNGDGFAVSNPHVYLPGLGQLTVAHDGAVLLVDGPRIRRIAPGADAIVTGAADEITTTVGGYVDWATLSQISNFNGDTFATQSLFGAFMAVAEDSQGRIIVVDGNNFRVRRFGLAPAPANPNSADLSIAASGSPDPVDTDADLRYVITVTNDGPATATGVTMTYVIPSGAVFQSAQSRNGIPCTVPAVGAAGTVTCDFGSVASGASNNVPITIRWRTAGSRSSTFTVAGSEVDPDGANNTTVVATTVHLASAVITVDESITITDGVGLLPAAIIGVNENIVVTDAPALQPSAMIGVNETIVVSDSLVVLPPVTLTVTETVIVTDTENVAVPNSPPVVNAGLDRNAEATSAAGATVALSGVATDADNDQLTLTWTGPCGSATGASVSLNCAFGSQAIAFTADDGHGHVVSDTVVITVRDTTAPALTLPADIGALAPTGASGVAVTFTATATDIVSGSITPACVPASGSTFAIGTTTVTCTATDAAGNQASGSFSVAVAQLPPPLIPPPTLQLPGNITALATSAAGAVVTYTATATVTVDTILGPIVSSGPALCTPPSGSTFPIGTTTVTCIASGGSGPFPLFVTGSFTVTVVAGAPSLTINIANKGRDPDGSFWVDLRLTNTGTGHARNVNLASLTLQRLTGTGTVTYNAARSGPLPMAVVAALDVGATQTVRLYLNVPTTVLRFSITEGVTLQNVTATTLTLSAGQVVFP